MTNYLTPYDSGAFLDYPKREPTASLTQECPRCYGHGGWNLRLNSYTLPTGVQDTPEARHRYVHFKAHCTHCSGWGYVPEEQTCTGHEWTYVRTLGRCHELLRCSICGTEQEVDSTD
jgi:hypothetical protein